MKYEIDLFTNFSFLEDLYRKKAEELNQKEEIFRTQTRFITHPHFKISRRITKTWITIGGIFTLNATMYEYIENNKLKRTMYYHDDILKNLAVSKYDFELIKACILADLNNTKIPLEFIKNQPSRQHLLYLKKRFKIYEQIAIQNDIKIEKNKAILKASQNDEIHIEMDDLFINIQGEKYGEKLRCREAILHTNFMNNSSKKGGVLCLFFLKKVREKTTKNNDLNYVSNKLNYYLNSLNINKNNVILKGDGARWINKIAQNLGVKHTLDYFHLVKKIAETFGFNRYANKENKEVFLNWYSQKYNLRWWDLFKYVFSYECKGGYEIYLKLKHEFLQEAQNIKLENKIISNVRSLFKFIESNKFLIWNYQNKFNLVPSYTEFFVFNFFKKHTLKDYSTFNLETIKAKIMYKNFKKHVGTIFL